MSANIDGRVAQRRQFPHQFPAIFRVSKIRLIISEIAIDRSERADLLVGVDANRNRILSSSKHRGHEHGRYQTHHLAVYIDYTRYMAKKKEATAETPVKAAPAKAAPKQAAPVEAAPVREPQISKKIPKLAPKNKRRLPRKEKKAQKKAALKA